MAWLGLNQAPTLDSDMVGGCRDGQHGHAEGQHEPQRGVNRGGGWGVRGSEIHPRDQLQARPPLLHYNLVMIYVTQLFNFVLLLWPLLLVLCITSSFVSTHFAYIFVNIGTNLPYSELSHFHFMMPSGYIEPVLVILHEREPTWAGRISSKSQTCMLSAFSISMGLKQHPMIWSAAVSVQDQS